jgi:hypothetical protein
MADVDGNLEVPGGYCWGYTKWVYQRHSPKSASEGGPSGVVWQIAYRAAQLPRRYWTQALMADPEIGPWRIRIRPMADPEAGPWQVALWRTHRT